MTFDEWWKTTPIDTGDSLTTLDPILGPMVRSAMRQIAELAWDRAMMNCAESLALEVSRYELYLKFTSEMTMVRGE